MKFLEKLESRFLLAPKLVYLIVNLQFYGFHQLRFAFAKDKFGVSEEHYGKFTGYTQFITFFTNILLGNYSDKTKKYKPMLLSLIILSTVVFLHFYINSLMNIHSLIFWVFILLYLVTNNPKAPLLDKIMLEYLDSFAEIGSKVYGKQRLWGTLALSMATYLCEWCTSNGDGTFDFNYLIHYNIIATVIAALGVIFLIRPNKNSAPHENQAVAETKEEKPQESAPQQQVSKSAAFLELFKNKEFMFFIFIIFSNAVTRSALTIYLSIFHKDILKIRPYDLPSHWPIALKSFVDIFNSKPIATLATFGIVFEMGVMFVADKILDRLGYFWPLILAQIISMVRFLAYYLIPSDSEHVYGLSCLFELLRGIYFGMIHISSVHIAQKLAPPYLKATSQMMYQGTFAAMGSLVSGYFFGDLFKSKLTKESSLEQRENVYKLIFLINFVVSFLTVLLCFIKYGLVDKVLFSREKENQKLNSYEIEDQTVEIKAQ